MVAGPTGDDVYLSTRGEFGNLKISLHASGYCQHGFTQRMRDELPVGQREALDKWKRRQGPAGVRELVYRIVLPGRSMVLHHGSQHRQALPIPLSSADREVVIDLCFTEPPAKPLEAYPNGPRAASTELGRGTLLEVLVQERHTDPGIYLTIERALAVLQPTWLPGKLYDAGPGYSFGWDPRPGVRCATEFA